jgi:hypothetical protein
MEAQLFSDSDLNRDFRSDLAGRAGTQADSALAWSWRLGDLLLSLDGVVRQDLRVASQDLFGPEAADTIHRAGGLALRWTPTLGPALFSLRLELANLSSFGSAWKDWGLDGVPDIVGDGEGDGRLSDGELRRALRLLLEPAVILPVPLSRFALLEARAAHRQLLYLPHGPDAPSASTRGLTFSSLEVMTQLSRPIFEGQGGHRVRPWAMLAGAWPSQEGDGAAHVLDVWDRLVRRAEQALLGLDSAWFLRTPDGGWRRVLSLGVLQSTDLLLGQLGQLGAQIEWETRWLSGRAGGAWDWRRSRVAEVDGSLQLSDARGDFLRAAYLLLPSWEEAGTGLPLPLSERVQREEGLPVGLVPEAYRAMGEIVHVVQVDAKANLGAGVALSAGANLDVEVGKLNWYGGGIAYRSDCRCFAVSVLVRMLRGQDIPDVFLTLDLATLGTAGVGSSTRF